jgi:hypothetical protein
VAWVNYFGYFGTYSVDEQNKAVIHRIEGSWFPNLVGTEQIRYYRFVRETPCTGSENAVGQRAHRLGKIQSSEL